MTLQFLRPAEVDGHGGANVSRLVAADGSVRRLPGGLARRTCSGSCRA